MIKQAAFFKSAVSYDKGAVLAFPPDSDETDRDYLAEPIFRFRTLEAIKPDALVTNFLEHVCEEHAFIFELVVFLSLRRGQAI